MAGRFISLPCDEATVIEPIQEVAWLLRFFSQPVQAQWTQVGPSFDHVWLSVGAAGREIAEPTHLLAIVFVESLLDSSALLRDGGSASLDTLLILDELRVLLDAFVIESFRHEVFQQVEDPYGNHLIWRTVARVCKAALEQPEVSAWVPGDLTFGWFLKRYTTPLKGI